MKHGPKEFSWFIYRMTNPIMRDFFMGPKNLFRVKEALLSVLAGDIYGKTPIWRSIRIFKLLYYIANLIQPRRATGQDARTDLDDDSSDHMKEPQITQITQIKK